MPTECELKFSFIDDVPSSEELQAVFEREGFELVARGTLKHFDVYFDDDKNNLRKAGIALRKRRVSGKVLATLKANAKVSGGLHEREELEDLMLGSNWPDEIYKRLEVVTDPWSLTERLELSNIRTRYIVQSKGSELAVLSFDVVTANYPGVFDTATFEEVEIEAMGNAGEAELRRVAAILENLIKLSPNSVNKLERAEALLDLSQSFRE